MPLWGHSWRYTEDMAAVRNGMSDATRSLPAVDNGSGEYRALLKEVDTQMHGRRQAAGEEIDPCEHISGVVLEPGYRRLQQNGRLLRRLFNTVPTSMKLLGHLELPRNVGVIRAGRQEPDGC